MIGTGPGIYKTFGWTPVGKIVHTADDPLAIDITNMLDNGAILVVHAACVSANALVLRVNGDVGANYDRSLHSHGQAAGALHSQADDTSETGIIIGLATRTTKIRLEFQYHNAMLLIHGKWVAYMDATHFESVDLFGRYTQDAPYTALNFFDDMAANWSGNFQLFRGVYSF